MPPRLLTLVLTYPFVDSTIIHRRSNDTRDRPDSMPYLRDGTWLFGSELADPPRPVVCKPEVAKDPRNDRPDVLHLNPPAVRTDR